MKRLHKRIYFLVATLILIGLVITGLNQGLTVKHYTIEQPYFHNDDQLVIVVISDLHSTIYGENQEPLVQKIVTQNPDLIFLTGDIIDDIVPRLGTYLLLEQIRDIAPIYYVTGNHEYWSYNIETIRAELKQYNVHILSDTYVEKEIKGIKMIIAGIDDPDKMRYEDSSYDQKRSMQSAFSDMPRDNHLSVLLAHRPERISMYQKYPFDLVISGHAHGGQVRIPGLLNGLYAPNQGWFPEYAGGIYWHQNLIHIVSRGLSITPRLPRIFNPPELVVIHLKAKD